MWQGQSRFELGSVLGSFELQSTAWKVVRAGPNSLTPNFGSPIAIVGAGGGDSDGARSKAKEEVGIARLVGRWSAWRRRDVDASSEARAKTPPCINACPNHNNIRGALTAIAFGEDYGRTADDSFKMAWEILAETNPLPAMCGRVCPHPCETDCNRSDKDGSLSVNAIERAIGDFGIERTSSSGASARHVRREDRGDRLGPGGTILRLSAGASRLSCHGVRGVPEVRRHAALRHPKVSSAPGGARCGSRQAREARRRVQVQHGSWARLPLRGSEEGPRGDLRGHRSAQGQVAAHPG